MRRILAVLSFCCRTCDSGREEIVILPAENRATDKVFSLTAMTGLEPCVLQEPADVRRELRGLPLVQVKNVPRIGSNARPRPPSPNVAHGHSAACITIEERSVDVVFGSAQRLMQLTLEDGTRRRGIVLIEMPHERPRVLDFLNSETHRFLTLYAGGTATLVNRQAVACVRPLD